MIESNIDILISIHFRYILANISKIIILQLCVKIPGCPMHGELTLTGCSHCMRCVHTYPTWKLSQLTWFFNIACIHVRNCTTQKWRPKKHYRIHIILVITSTDGTCPILFSVCISSARFVWVPRIKTQRDLYIAYL